MAGCSALAASDGRPAAVCTVMSSEASPSSSEPAAPPTHLSDSPSRSRRAAMRASSRHSPEADCATSAPRCRSRRCRLSSLCGELHHRPSSHRLKIFMAIAIVCIICVFLSHHGGNTPVAGLSVLYGADAQKLVQMDQFFSSGNDTQVDSAATSFDVNELIGKAGGDPGEDRNKQLPLLRNDYDDNGNAKLAGARVAEHEESPRIVSDALALSPALPAIAGSNLSQFAAAAIHNPAASRRSKHASSKNAEPEEKVFEVRLKKGETKKVSYYDPDGNGHLEAKYGYRIASNKRVSNHDKLMQRLKEQENQKDAFHFDQSYDVDKNNRLSRLGIVLSSKDCTISPSPVVQPDATYMIIECPSNIARVTAQFLSGAPFKEAIDANGWFQQKKLTWDLEASGAIATQYIKACIDPKIPDTCYSVQVDARRRSTSVPTGLRLFTSHSVKSPLFWNPHSPEYKLKAYENEPFGVTLESASNVFADEKPIEPEHGFVDQVKRLMLRPRGPHMRKQLYLTNRDHSVANNVSLDIETVPSVNPNLYDLRPAAGRLDPLFKPTQYTYYLRISDWLSLTLFRLTGMDDKNVVCSYVDNNGQMRQIVGSGSTRPISLGTERNPSIIVIDCHHPNVPGAPEPKSRYIIQTVFQAGGSTLLKQLDVVGAELQQPFDPEIKGPYQVSLRKHHGDPSENDTPWVSFIAKPKNKNAQVSVEGFPVDPHSGMSPYFRISIGESRKFKVAVRTKENPVAEIYEVIVSRNAPGISWIGRVADWLGYVSSAISSPRAYTFIHNAKFLQWMSVTDRINLIPETWSIWSGYMNKFNMQWSCPKLVRLGGNNRDGVTRYRQPFYATTLHTGNFTGSEAYVAPPTPYGEILSAKFDSWHPRISNTDYQLPWAFEWSAAAGDWVATFADVSAIQTVLEHLRQQDAAAALAVAFKGDDENGGDLSTPDDNVVENKSFWQCAPGDDCTEIESQAAEWEAKMAMRRNASAERREKTNSTSSRQRKLLKISPEDRQDLIEQLEEAHSQATKLLYFSTSFTSTTIGLAVLGVLYMFLWVVWLRSNYYFTVIRRDFPRILYPARFWSFVLDYALISYFQACCGLLFTPLKDMNMVVLGYETTPGELARFSIALMIIYPIAFVCIGTLLLALHSGNFVFMTVFQKRGQPQPQAFKAFYQPFSWAPIVGRLFDIEIARIIDAVDVTDGDGEMVPPLLQDKYDRAPWDVPDSKAVFMTYNTTTYEEEQHLMVTGAKRSKLPRGYKLYKKLDAVKIGAPEYRGLNSNYSMTTKYPTAFLWYMKQPIRNTFGEEIQVYCRTFLSHWAQICACRARPSVIVPREHFDFYHYDALSNLAAKAQMGNLFYWAIDRFALVGLIVLMSWWQDANGTRTILAFAFTAAVLCVIHFPGVLRQSISAWYRQMEVDYRLEEKVQKYDSEMEKQFSVWPFRGEAARATYERLRIRKEQQKSMSLLYGLYSLIFDFYNHVRYLDFWKTRAAMATGLFLSGPCFSELSKFLISFLLFLGSKKIVSNGFASIGGVSISVVAVVFLNWEAIVLFWHQLQEFAYEFYIQFRRTCIIFVDFSRDFGSLGKRLGFYLRQIGTFFVRRRQSNNVISFIYPGFQKESLRHFDLQEVSVVCTEMGVHMTGKTHKPTNVTRKIFYEDDPMALPRYSIQKTLFISSTIAVHREELDRSLPVALPFPQFVASKHEANSRVAATIQFVNHAGLRYLPRIPHDWRDDSYLTLFTDEVLVPPPSQLKKGHIGHGYVVKLDKVAQQLIIRGPNIIPNKRYHIKFTANPPPLDPLYSYDEVSLGSSLHRPGYSEAMVTCRDPGRLVVKVPEGCKPDLQEEIAIFQPGDPKEHLHDPAISKVFWDPNTRLMMIPTRHALLAGDMQYKVVWKIKPQGGLIEATTNEPVILRGQIVLAPPPDGRLVDIDSNAFCVIRDLDKTMTIDIDPRDTNRYEFTLSQVQDVRGSSGWLTHKAAIVSGEIETILGGSDLNDSVIERIPCTLVQCIDPMTRRWRVEPDFTEAILRVAARKEEILAQSHQLSQVAVLPDLWPRIISAAEFVNFWKKTVGIDVTDTRGGFIDPLRNISHPSLHNIAHLIRAAEPQLERLLANKLSDMASRLSGLQAVYKAWGTAYGDMTLYAAQAELDAIQQDPSADLEDVATQIEIVRQAKSRWQASIPGFCYPMVVPENLISKAANWEAQFQQWEEVLRKWLLYEEGADTQEKTQGDLSCHEFTLQQIMKALRYTAAKPENLLLNRTHTALHYVASSFHVRGPRIHWKPDPLGSMLAIVRLWACDENGEPQPGRKSWTICFIKLTGTAVRVSIPLEAPQGENLQPWNQVRSSWYIPLKCFQEILCLSDPSPIPEQEFSHDFSGTMTGLLVFRRNTEAVVDDNYVKRCSDDEFDNSFGVTPEGVPRRLLLGFTFPKAVYNDPQNGDRWWEYQDAGDRAYVNPLTFRLWPSDLARWESVISACKMNIPPRDAGDFDGRVPRNARLPPSVPSTPRPMTPPRAVEPLPVILDQDTSSLTSSSSSSSAFGETSEDTSSLEGSYHGEPSLPPTPPPRPVPEREVEKPAEPSKPKGVPLRQIAEEFADWRYSGPGGVCSPSGEEVYDGQWYAAQRNGNGRALFEDTHGKNWRYRGGFWQDEPYAHGELMLDDLSEQERLKHSEDPTDKLKIVGFVGNFSVPKRLTRGDTTPTASHPLPDLGTVDNLYDEQKFNKPHIRLPGERRSRGDSSDGGQAHEVAPRRRDSATPMDDKLPPYKSLNRTLMLDRRRAMSASGHEIVLGVTMANLNEFFWKNRGHRNLEEKDDDDPYDQPLGDAKVPSYEYLPHTGHWARAIDPSLGQYDIGGRFAVGEVHYADGTRYRKLDSRGLLNNGPDGFGHYHCPVCPLNYFGDFRKFRPETHGCLEYKTGDDKITYWGGFQDGRRHGPGIVSAWGGKLYIEGNFENDMMSGFCRVSVHPDLYPKVNFEYFEGEFLDGLPNGRGEVAFYRRGKKGTVEPGLVYRGEFRDGLRQGQGIITDHDGNPLIKGEWTKDEAGGAKDVYYLPNGLVYIGPMKNNERSGQGKLFESIVGGLIYDGTWDKDMADGRGFAFASEGVYEGEFKQGRREGKGKFTFTAREGESQRRIYEGSWLEDRPHGVGTFVASDGVTYAVEFNRGLLVSKSARAYKQGMCGSPPHFDELQLSDIPALRSQHKDFQEKGCQIDRALFVKLRDEGGGIWIDQHEPHKFRYRRIEGPMPPVPERPTRFAGWEVTAPMLDPQDVDYLYKIIVHRAVGLPKSGVFNPRALCRLEVNHHSWFTKAEDSLTPEWNETKYIPFDKTFKLLKLTVANRGHLGSSQDLVRQTDTALGHAVFDLIAWQRAGMVPQEQRATLQIQKPGKEVEDVGSIYFTVDRVHRNEAEDADIYHDARDPFPQADARNYTNMPAYMKDKLFEAPNAY